MNANDVMNVSKTTANGKSLGLDYLLNILGKQKLSSHPLTFSKSHMQD